MLSKKNLEGIVMSDTVVIALLSSFVTLVAALFMAIPGFLAFRQQRRAANAEAIKTEAEAVQIYTKMAQESIEQGLIKSTEFLNVKRDLDRLKAEFVDLSDMLIEWADGINVLLEQICSMKTSPKWRPPDSDLLKIERLKQRLQDQHSPEGD
jgi:hypothetical protein